MCEDGPTFTGEPSNPRKRGNKDAKLEMMMMMMMMVVALKSEKERNICKN